MEMSARPAQHRNWQWLQSGLRQGYRAV